MKHQDTELTKMEAIVILLDLGRTADELTCRAAMLGAKALARHLKHKAACHASRVARGLPARQAQKKNNRRRPAMNNRMKPHKMRSVKEWMEIYRRASNWTGGVWNGNRRQCPVCFRMFEPTHPRRKGTRCCSKECRRVWNQSARYANRARQAQALSDGK